VVLCKLGSVEKEKAFYGFLFIGLTKVFIPVNKVAIFLHHYSVTYVTFAHCPSCRQTAIFQVNTTQVYVNPLAPEFPFKF